MGTAATPLAIGTRGTVGSLVRREIEYFRRVELDRPESSMKPCLKKLVPVSETNTTTATSSSRSSKTIALGSLLTMSWRRKKRRVSNSNSSSSNTSSFLPSMCSAVEVSESKRFDGIPGFSYRNLKSDIGNAIWSVISFLQILQTGFFLFFLWLLGFI